MSSILQVNPFVNEMLGNVYLIPIKIFIDHDAVQNSGSRERAKEASDNFEMRGSLKGKKSKLRSDLNDEGEL